MSEKPTLNDVMYAILAIDAYVRGDDFQRAFEEVDGSEFQKQVGQATVKDDKGDPMA